MKRVWKWVQDCSNSIRIQDETGETMCEITSEEDIEAHHEERARLICNAVNAYPQQLPSRPKKPKSGKEIEPQ